MNIGQCNDVKLSKHVASKAFKKRQKLRPSSKVVKKLMKTGHQRHSWRTNKEHQVGMEETWRMLQLRRLHMMEIKQLNQSGWVQIILPLLLFRQRKDRSRKSISRKNGTRCTLGSITIHHWKEYCALLVWKQKNLT